MFDTPIKKPNTFKSLNKIGNWKQATQSFEINHSNTCDELKRYQYSRIQVRQKNEYDKNQPISPIIFRGRKSKSKNLNQFLKRQINCKSLENDFLKANNNENQQNQVHKQKNDPSQQVKGVTHKRHLSHLENLLSEINQQSVYDDQQPIQKDSDQATKQKVDLSNFIDMKNKFKKAAIIPSNRYQLYQSDIIQEHRLNPQQALQQPKLNQKKFNSFALSLLGIKRKSLPQNRRVKQSLRNQYLPEITTQVSNNKLQSFIVKSQHLDYHPYSKSININKILNRFVIPVTEYKRWLPKQADLDRQHKRASSMQQIKQVKKVMENPQMCSFIKYPQLDSDYPFSKEIQLKIDQEPVNKVQSRLKISENNKAHQNSQQNKKVKYQDFQQNINKKNQKQGQKSNARHQNFQENSKLLNFISQLNEENDISCTSQSKYSPSRNRKRQLPQNGPLNSKEVMKKVINFKTTIQQLRKIQRNYKLKLINQVDIVIPQFFFTIQITPQIDLTNLHSLALYIFKFLGFPTKSLAFKRYQHSVAIINSVKSFVKRNHSQNKLAFVYHFQGQKMYFGQWNDRKTGIGLQWKPGNYIYYGQFINGKRDGLGAMKSQSRDFYLGYWRKGWKIQNI